MRIPIAFSLLLISIWVHADVPDDAERCNPWPECGWWFGYIDPLKQKQEEEIQQSKIPESKAEETKEEAEDKCKQKDSWISECGFIDPGNDFDFQSLQRDKLYRRSVMNPHDQKAVEDFQYYMKWAVGQALKMAKMAYFNRVQNPEIDPNVRQPVSTFGLKLLSSARDLRDSEIFSTISESGGLLVWFTRSDCSYCHEMVDTIEQVGNKTGIEVSNLSLDDSCFEKFTGERCQVGNRAIEAAKVLQIKIVPSLFLYLPDDNSWIRVATGIESVSTIMQRMVQFFSAVRTAAANNLNNGIGMRPSVDFSRDQVFETPGLGSGSGVPEEVNQ